jgi:hypothetical protein
MWREVRFDLWGRPSWKMATGKQFLVFISITVPPIEKRRIEKMFRITFYTKNVPINCFVKATVERQNQKNLITHLLRAVR